MNYLDQKEELEKHAALSAAKGMTDDGRGMRTIIEHLAAGDQVLFDAMWSFANFAHAFDDLIDESGWNAEQREAAVTMLHDAVVDYLTAEFEGTSHEQLGGRYLNWTFRFEPVRRAAARKAWLDFFGALAANPLIVDHAAQVRAVLVQALTRCLDGDTMAASVDPIKRQLAPAVRCGDVDVIFHLVYLARGWAALRECSKFREYDLGDPKEAV